MELMELTEIVEKIGLPCTVDEESVLYDTGKTCFYLERDILQYTTFIPVSSRHRFNVLVEQLPENVLAYNLRAWFRSEPLKKLSNIQNQDPKDDQQAISFQREEMQEHIPELIDLIQMYFSCFATANP